MKHEIVFLGKTKDSILEKAIAKYHARLNCYTRCNIVVVKDKVSAQPRDVLLKKQGELLLGAVSPGDFVVVLDSRGEQMTSECLAKTISRWERMAVKKVCYLIGGPDGLAEAVLAAGQQVLSLSQMTFTHDMTRMLLLEQLYRAYTIKNGEKYHKGG
ncbi:MAG: 23S rRNA (pseudouridine(1915)-N(3))-methyltransferase RlmH [Deltaproteobacteria bacterium]|nr:MAG: 23S rRNA (pseudouridine(1915)-N(3))-methyltransferase RlmH [Deltaproteobacteria bacterium]